MATCYTSCVNWNNFCLFSCATTGEGLFEGLQWLSQNVKKRQQNVFVLYLLQTDSIFIF
jgi:hypothetical protein